AAGHTPDEREGPAGIIGGAIGLLSAAVAVAVGHLMAGLVGGTSSPVIAVGSTAIDASPGWLKSYAIRTFGTNDKAVLVAGIGRAEATASRAAVRIPAPADVAPLPPAGADLHIPDVGPFITPNDPFYRVDTSLLVPSVTAEGWTLRIHGMVRQELSLDYATLL